MDRFCGYRHLSCADSAVGSRSDRACLIERDHSGSCVLVCMTIVIFIRALVVVVAIVGRLLWRAVVVLFCLFVLFIHFRHLRVFVVLPTNPFVMELITMALPAVAFLAPEGWREYV
jgi:hypothetical protein